MVRSIVGIDIGATAVRAAEVSDSGSAQPTLERFGEVPLPIGSVKDGSVLRPEPVADALRTLWSEQKFGSRIIALGVGNKRVLVRDTSLPSMPLAQLKESLAFQVQDSLPVAVSDALLDFYPVSEVSTANGNMLSGLLVAAIKGPVQANIDAVRQAKLTPGEVDLIAFAQTRAFARRGETRSETVALVDVGANSTNVVIVAGGVPQFVRIIGSGGDDVTEALIASLEVAYDDAVRMKQLVGVRAAEHPEAARAQTVIAGVVNPLLASLRDTITYYNGSHPGEQIRRVVLSGGGAQLPGFAEGLANAAHTNVTFGDPLASLKPGRALDSAKLPANRSTMAVAIGLAMGDDDE